MLLRTLASGSGGNCILVQQDDTAILIDAGISCKKITTRLQASGLDPEALDAIFLTHEHSDHIAGLRVFLKRYPTPVYATAGTGNRAAEKYPVVGELLHTFSAGETVEVGALEVQSFSTPHDAADSVGYRCTGGGHSLAVVTDLGWVPEEVRTVAAGVELALIEANHDEEWLKSGPYALPLQNRILGDHGHLCNETGGAFGAYLARHGAKTLVLGHLSQENNTPEHAYQVVSQVLEQSGVHPALEVAPRDALSRPYYL